MTITPRASVSLSLSLYLSLSLSLSLALSQQILKITPKKQLLYDHSPPIPQMIQVRRTKQDGHSWLRKEETNKWRSFMEALVLADSQGRIYISSVQTLRAV